MADNISIPSSRVDLIDPRTGTISREWFLYLSRVQAAATTPSDDVLSGPDVSSALDQITELGKSIQDVELSVLPGTDQTFELDYLNVVDFGVNGSTTDAANMATAIAASIAQSKKLYVPAIYVNMGNKTLTFPPTIPLGYKFECHPGAIIDYTGTGDAILIDSCGLSVFIFPHIRGSGGANGIHIKPTVNGSFGPPYFPTCTCNQFTFNVIEGFYCGIYADTSVGDFAQNNINGMFIYCGRGGIPDGTMVGDIAAILADGAPSPRVYQGNMWNINYIEAYPLSYDQTTPTTCRWIGIVDGSATMGAVSNDLNTYQFGAIDGFSPIPTWYNAYGIVSFGSNNMFIGPVVNTLVCITMGSTAYFNYIVSQCLSNCAAPPGTAFLIVDLSTVTTLGAWHWTWEGANNGKIGHLQWGDPPNSPPFIIGNAVAATALPAGVPTIIPIASIGGSGYPGGLAVVGGGILVQFAGFYTIKAGALITAVGMSPMQIGIGINGAAPANVVAATSATAIQAPMSCSCDVYLNAGDTVFLGGVSGVNAAVTWPSPINALSVIGRIG